LTNDLSREEGCEFANYFSRPIPLISAVIELNTQIPSIYHFQQVPPQVSFKTAVKREEAPDFSRASSSSFAIWTRRADSNRRTEDLQFYIQQFYFDL
jgi:hypothetical protein